MARGLATRDPAGLGPALLEAVGITKRFGPVTVLRDVNLRIGRGEVVALVGENGAGKSVLVACLARILEADSGELRLEGEILSGPASHIRAAGVEVVWQDHGLCDDLDVIANVHLGREPARYLPENRMRDSALGVLRRVGAGALPLDRPVRTLSRGQRQLVAVARALLNEPRVVLLDEPTASLGVAETLRIQALIRECRNTGTGLLLVTHDLEQVFAVADRIMVLREGRLVADTSPRTVNRDDIVALMSGIGMDSMARRQLHRLRSLVDQLSDVEPAASLPLIVSAMATALDQEMLCVHLLEDDGGPAGLRRTAAIGLPDPLLEVNGWLPVGPGGGGAGLAAAEAEAVAIDDLSAHPGSERYRQAAAASGIRSEWAAPIVGARGVLGTVSGFATSVGRPEPAQFELARLYLGYAASAIERERLLSEVSRRNRVLESLRAMLESLAGPVRVDGGLGASLTALSRALDADAVAVFVDRGSDLTLHASTAGGGTDADPPDAPGGNGADHRDQLVERLRDAATALVGDETGRPRLVEPDLAAVTLRHPEGRAVLVARLPGDDGPAADALELLGDATRSLALALEGEVLEQARREAAALRRSQAIQRELLSSLSHELRTPLTAIQGYASTLRQPDLTWDAESTERFLGSIATEAARLERLVGDLLDSSAIESGVLRLQRDWCDLQLVVEAALRLVADGPTIRLHVAETLEPIWGDHDRLEQVFVNLVENAAAHGASDHGIDVTLGRGPVAGTVQVEVRDHGPGLPPELGERIFEPRVQGPTVVTGAGLGLPLARAIVEAHGGILMTMPVERGASFVVSLPAEPDEAAVAVPEASWNLFDDAARTEAARPEEERHVV